MAKTTVYIVQPMSGRTNEEIMEERARAVEAITLGLGVDVNPVPKLINNMERGAVWNLGNSLKQMDSATVVACLPGFEDHKGCLIERAAAEYYGYRILDLRRNGDGFDADVGQMRMPE